MEVVSVCILDDGMEVVSVYILDDGVRLSWKVWEGACGP